MLRKGKIELCDNADGISEDRMIALRKRAEVDSKYLVIFNIGDDLHLKQSLVRQVTFFFFYKYSALRISLFG